MLRLKAALPRRRERPSFERGRRLAGDAGSGNLWWRVHAEQSLIEIDCKGEVN